MTFQNIINAKESVMNKMSKKSFKEQDPTLYVHIPASLNSP